MKYNREFQFCGDTYTVNTLLEACTMKVYHESYHLERKLIKDCYGRLFIYNYEEEMRFDGDNDRVDHLWVLVRDIRDADNLAENSRLLMMREPFIAADESGWFNVVGDDSNDSGSPESEVQDNKKDTSHAVSGSDYAEKIGALMSKLFGGRK